MLHQPEYFKKRCMLLTLSMLSSLFPVAGNSQVLTHGPLVGAVTATSARFYLRVEPSGLANIRIDTTLDFSNETAGAAMITDPVVDFTALIDFVELTSNQRYYYQALVNGQPIGETHSFTTFPEEGARARFHFAFGSCIARRKRPSPDDGRVFSVMAKDRPKFFLQIGDWTYSDTTDSQQNPQRVFSADLARIQETYRAKYDSGYALQQVLRVAPVDYVYDDHDYMNDDASALSYPIPDSFKTIHVSPVVRENNIRAYQELFPGYPLANAEGGIWHTFTCGNADFFVLDTRSQRSPNLEAFVYNPVSDSMEFSPPENHSLLAGDANLAGENQLDWLLRGLRDSVADWKFIVSTVPFNRAFGKVIDRSVSLQDSMIVLPDRGAISVLQFGVGVADKWAGFPADQQKLLRFIEDNEITNVIVLSGDLHTAAIDDGANAGLPELMAGALDRKNSRLVALMQIFGFDIWNGGGQSLATQNFKDAYGRVTVCGADSVVLEIIDESGSRVAHKTILSKSLTPVSSPQISSKPPRAFRLHQSFPNPFRPQSGTSGTTIEYDLPQRSVVAVSIHSLLGKAIRRFRPVWLTPGRHRVQWDGRDEQGAIVASGTYWIRVRSATLDGREQMGVQKVVLVR